MPYISIWHHHLRSSHFLFPFSLSSTSSYPSFFGTLLFRLFPLFLCSIPFSSYQLPVLSVVVFVLLFFSLGLAQSSPIFHPFFHPSFLFKPVSSPPLLHSLSLSLSLSLPPSLPPTLPPSGPLFLSITLLPFFFSYLHPYLLSPQPHPYTHSLPYYHL